jgi:pyridoxal phosphate enzyme (YggS family)
MYDTLIEENLPKIREAIHGAAQRSGREGKEVTLVAVTKAHPVEAVRACLDAGMRDLGENRLEELEQKVQTLGREGITWHMVGHIQSRKARAAVELAHLIHSVDTEKLAGRLSRFAQEEGIRIPVLVQVNVAGEEAKSGFSRDEAVEGVHRLVEMPGLDVRGLMTMAPFVAEEPVLREVFAGLRKIQEKAMSLPEYQGRELSMGMTNDFELAVEEGSTMVRIGTALLGERPR